jgi:phytoene dehydrogenase-like protein
MAVLWLAAAALGADKLDLKQIQAEPNLERRSKLALEHASSALQEAREAYRNGENDKTAALAAEIQESVEIAAASLKQTGKDPRRSPKWFKNAEIATRDLLRKLDTFQQDMSFNDRPVLEKVKEKVQQVHDDLLLGLMEGKKR